jgi:hypothetical protein
VIRARIGVLAALVLAACSVGGGDPFPGALSVGSAGSATSDGSTGGTSDGSSSGAVGSDGGSSSNAGDSTSGGATSASTTSEGSSDSGDDATTTGASGGGDPLDPDLDVPNGGEECETPGDLNECPGIAVCRFATSEHGLCESCDECGNLNAPCVEGTDCDILFSCYAGHCTNFCTLGTFECGPVEDCIDIGHPTHGVCDPFA